MLERIYNDPQKDFLIAYFNDLGKDPKLVPKTILRLPILEISQPKADSGNERDKDGPERTLGRVAGFKGGEREQGNQRGERNQEMMAKAEINFKANKFKETVSITEEILLHRSIQQGGP